LIKVDHINYKSVDREAADRNIVVKGRNDCDLFCFEVQVHGSWLGLS
jgi:hypothetical protein